MLGIADTGTQVWAEAWTDTTKTLLITSRTATITVGSVAVAPSISSQPVATTATVGGTASFSVGAGGTAPLSYQWRLNGVALTDHAEGSGSSGAAGSGSPVLLLSNVQTGDAGNYSVVVSNGTAPDGVSSGAALAVSPGSMGTGTGSVIALSAGWQHNCAIKSDHTLVCWGRNNRGQLGDGTTTERSNPRQVPNVTSVVAVTAGMDHTCVAKSDGTVACWGSNDAGQLGDGTTIDKLSPTVVPNLTGVVALVAGVSYTCASKTDGAVVCWGSNNHGQLGDGTTTNQLSPVVAYNLHEAVTLFAAGGRHTCLFSTSWNVYCWGENSYGQLGDGSTADRYLPVGISGATSVIAIAAGYDHTCAAQGGGIGGTVVCWGGNLVGQLGDGTTTGKSSATPISNLSNVVSLAAGYGFSCAATSSGSVKCWGSNLFGNLGDGSTVKKLSPVVVPGLMGIVAVSAGLSHTCAIKSDGSVACWGANGYGQLGDGTFNSHLSPVNVVF